MAGNFMWARQYSGILATQIQAVEQGLNKEYWSPSSVAGQGWGRA